MSKKQKYYVVWKGISPGIYTSWTDCQLQINGFTGAIYKSFKTLEGAEEAYASSPSEYIGSNATKQERTSLQLPEDFEMNCWAVDAACSGNPGPMEYRGVDLLSGKEIFHYGPLYGTNNIGEFLAIVHALALMKRENISKTIYSDSRNALNWVKRKKCRTRLERTEKTENLFQIIERAEKWLQTNDYSHIPILKWETEEWGEVPAVFGRK